MTVNNSPIFFKKRTNILINFSNISNNFFSQFSSQNMKKEKKSQESREVEKKIVRTWLLEFPRNKER